MLLSRVTVAVFAAFCGLVLPVSPAHAAPDVRIDTPVNLIDQAKDYFGIRDSFAPSTCKRRRATIDEIVVCGRDDQAERIKPLDVSPFRLDPRQIAFGKPPPGAGTGVSATMRGCFLQKCGKPVVLIDVKALPEAPSGSDADLIARGMAR